MTIVFTGNGKGKTTAALGQMVRAAGRGKRCLMIQFIKGPWRSGEDEFAEKLSAKDRKIQERFKIAKTGLGFVGILGDKLPREEHQKAAVEGLRIFQEERNTGNWDLIVLDEINVAVSLGLLAKEAVLGAVKDFPDEKLLILTGRNAPREFIDAADLVTDMKEVKHPFKEGKKGRLAAEF